jgi:hypothetical protein
MWSGQYFAFMTWLTSYAKVSGLAARLGRRYLPPVVVLLAFNMSPAGRSARPAAAAHAHPRTRLAWSTAGAVRRRLARRLLLIVYGIGAGVVPTCLFQVPHRIVGGAARAGAFGIVMAARNIGVLFGPLIL